MALISGSGAERAVAREEFDALPLHGQAALAEVMPQWAAAALCYPGRSRRSRTRTGLLELRVNVGSDPFRLIFFADSPVHDVIVLAINKNKEKPSWRELDRARRRRDEWRARRNLVRAPARHHASPEACG